MAPLVVLLSNGRPEVTVPAEPPAPTSHKRDPWHEALAYATSSGLSDISAHEFADHYPAYIEDRANEIRYPNLPLPTPSEFIP